MSAERRFRRDLFQQFCGFDLTAQSPIIQHVRMAMYYAETSSDRHFAVAHVFPPSLLGGLYHDIGNGDAEVGFA